MESTNLYYQNKTVCLTVCVYPSNAHTFGPMGMKLDMDIPWDSESDMG